MILKEYLFSFLKEEKNTLDFKSNNGETFVKIFVLEEDIIRVLFIDNSLKLGRTWLVAPGMEDVSCEGRDRLDISPFSLPKFKYKINNNKFVLETNRMKLIVNLDGFKINWFARENNEWISIAKDRKTQSYNYEGNLGKGIFHYMERNLEEQYFGLGEKAGKVDRHGRRYRMLNVDPMGYDAETSDPLYKHIPFYITRSTNNEISYGLFYDNLSTSTFEMGSELDNYHGYYRYYQGEDGDLDYYMILGPKINDVVKKFSWLTGKTIFQPKWCIGYSGSTMSYTDAPNAQEQLQKFIKDCKEQDIPCDSFQLSSGYTSIGNKRYVFNWNKAKVPTPKEMSESFHENGLKLCANIKPCLLLDHPKFEELKERNMFVMNRENKGPEIAQFWDDLGAYLDFTNPNTYKWWKNNIKEQLLEYGIDSTWNDNNEYEIWDNEAKVNGFGESINIGMIRPIQPLLMMKASYEAQKEYNPSIRPYLISRSGCPGMQRYVQTWSGDNRTSWKTLKYNIKMGIGLSLSGIYNLGHDVGGFAGPAPEPELLVRWVQNGIFHPRFTIHSWNEDGTVNEPWMYPEVTKYIRKLIKFRTRITPYLYNLLYRAHEYYEPMIRPTFYNFEDDEKTFEENDDFMLGESLLVASVVEKGKLERKVYLPKYEQGWYDFHTEKWYEGGQEVILSAPFDYTPLLAKAGSIIPINDPDITFETKSRDERGFMLFPNREEGETFFELYEDDGITMDYTSGCYTKININMKTTKEKLDITINKKGKYKLPYDDVRIYLPKHEARNIIINGKQCSINKENIYSITMK